MGAFDASVNSLTKSVLVLHLLVSVVGLLVEGKADGTVSDVVEVGAVPWALDLLPR